jgi:hypothetical protein
LAFLLQPAVVDVEEMLWKRGGGFEISCDIVFVTCSIVTIAA